MTHKLEHGDAVKNLDNNMSRVLRLVKEKPSAKGSYLILWCYYIWKHHGVRFPDNFFEDKRWHEIPSPESISRAYRKLKEQGLIEETEQTEENRKIAEQDWRAAMKR